MKKMCFNLDADLHKRLKIISAQLGIPVSVILHNLITAHLSKVERGKAA